MPAEPGRIIHGRYEVLNVVGSGRVLRARDVRHDRLVALALQPAPQDKGSAKAQTRALLGVSPHPNLPLVRDDLTDDGRHILVADWIEGASLTRLVERTEGGLPIPSVVRIARDVGRALDHLHRAGVVHGAVTPDNIIRRETGESALVGLAILDRRSDPPADVRALAEVVRFALSGQVTEATSLDAILDDPHEADPLSFVEALRAWAEASAYSSGEVAMVIRPIDLSAVGAEYPGAGERAAEQLAELVSRVAADHGGTVGDDGLDGHRAIFASVIDAARCALRLVERVSGERWPTPHPMRIGVGVHIDPAGGDPSRRARLFAAMADDGQIVLSAAAVEALGSEVTDEATVIAHGAHRLPDLGAPEEVFELRPLGAPSRGLRAVHASLATLPAQDGPFVGRAKERAEASELITTTRLVSFVGPGGSGKTALAAHVAADVVERFPDGIRFVDAGAGDRSGRDPATGSTREGFPSMDDMIAELAAARALIVLDGFDVDVDAAARWVDEVLRRCPDVVVLATGSEPLLVPGEAIVQVSPWSAEEVEE